MEIWKIILSVFIYSIVVFVIHKSYFGNTAFSVNDFHVQPDGHISHAVVSLPTICENEERLLRVGKWCKIQENHNNKSFLSTQSMTENKLRDVVRKILVDDKHKVLYCDIAKAGSTTWKHILANNTGHYSEVGLNPQIVHNLTYFRTKYNITELKLEDNETILYKLKNYYKFLVVRHPLDRLISAYRDKLAGTNKYFEGIVGRRILKRSRPNASREVITRGHGVTFSEFVNYVTKVHMWEQHFDHYQDHCQPCIINYDYVVKLETQASDGKYIINEHLSGYGADVQANRHSTRGGATTLKRLPEYERISDQRLQDLLVAYSKDMDMFGYSIVKRNQALFAACGDGHVADCC